MSAAAMTASGASPAMNFGTVAAIIRKDMRALWPFALALALAMLVISGGFHNVQDYPDITLRFGDGQMDIDGLLFFCSTAFLPIATAIFIVTLVQQDRATDARQDWLSRPIKAGELVLAKVLIVLAVVLAPSLLGNGFYVLNNFAPIDHFVGPVYFVAMQCVFFLVLGWLCSGPLQALLAPIGLVLAAAAIFIPVARVMTPHTRVEALQQADVAVPFPAPVEAPSVEPVAAASQIDSGWTATTALLVSIMAVALLASAVVLWLLLERRQVLRARLAFLGFFIVTVIVFAVQTTVIEASGPRISALPTRADRIGAFDRHDANGDGKMSRREYSLLLQDMGYWSQFNRYWPQRDTDKDGFLSREEYGRPMEDMPPVVATEEERFAAFRDNDANGDGRLDKAEYQNVLNELGYPDELDNFWVQRDRDGDGFLSLQEMEPEIGFAPLAASQEQRMTAFTQHDADHDNKLTKEEYAVVLRSLGFGGQVETYWPLRDADKDGFITEEEYRLALPQ